MLNNRNLLALLTVATAGLAACEPLFVDFDGYREYPPDSGAGNGGSGNGGSGNGGSTSGGDGGSAAGGSGNSGGDGGSAAGGSGNSGGNAGSGNAGSGNAAGDGGSGNAAGNGGSAGSGGDGCAPEDPETVCGPNMNCEFKSLVPPYDYSTECIPAGTGLGVHGCESSDSSMCAAAHLCFTGIICYRWCRLGSDDCAACAGGAVCQDSINPIPTRGTTQYGLCLDPDC